MPRKISLWLGSVVFPLVAIFLPWPKAVALFLRLAKIHWLYHPRVAHAQAAAQAAEVDSATGPNWANEYRFVELVDRADGYLSHFRSDNWLDDYVTVTGDPWPDEAFVGITFHFGAGLWAMRHLRRCGGRSSFLSTRFDATSFPNDYLSYLAARWRMAEVARVGGAPVIYTGGSSELIRNTLDSGVSVLGLIDVPSVQTHSTRQTEFFGRDAWFPPGLVALAREKAVPLVVFTMDIDSTSGRRQLNIVRIPFASEEQALQSVVKHLQRVVTAHPAAWHRWADFRLFFSLPPQ